MRGPSAHFYVDVIADRHVGAQTSPTLLSPTFILTLRRIMDVITGYLGLSSILSSNYVASSLNLMFFWMTWTTLVMTQPPLRVELLGSFAVRVLFYWIPTL